MKAVETTTTTQPLVGVLQVINAVTKAKPNCTNKEKALNRLCFVNAEVNKKKRLLSLVDNGASHNFMREEVAK